MPPCFFQKTPCWFPPYKNSLRLDPAAPKYVSISSCVSLSVPDLKNKTDWKRPEGVVAVVVVVVEDVALIYPEAASLLDAAGRTFYS